MGPERLLATDFAFRTEQQNATALGHQGLYASIGNFTVCALSVT